ncbi:NADPH:quinone oxidoreductase family protein [Shimia sp. CNT1-13L.2]|uniref:NADPH:quinone oxidoreductase family protein n=1 Tax=Shimia sp. CNT1-13L.2 TaxID=2959663 RepID=UPI0020CD9490|nr:NADPH:quinone oxidoreductase family protein [Shimia sp. CNT1-13L.2]MCP9481207.1 NADPH:quinone oxidoreductase family protein [Shimia sp. CNT1-13L.2]
MRAYQVASFETKPEIVDLPLPIPQKGEIRVKIGACGLNFADLLMQKGTYQDTPPLPFVGGLEVAGVVDALGPDTEGPAVGTRIAVFGGKGGLAEYGCFDVKRCVAIPETMSFTDAAAFLVAYGTSHVALDYRARMQPGETLLVLGAAGGVGLTAVEIGKVMGAKVIACARGADKLQIAKQAGADHLIDATTEDIREVVKSLGGADVVYDPVGGDQFKAAFRACNPDARLLPIGFASGDVPQIPANHLLVKNLTVIGLYWGAYLAHNPKVITDSLSTLFDWYAQGKIKPHVSNILPLEQTNDAMDLLRTRKSTGKVVVTMD